MQAQILAPAAALVLWSLVMVIWMAATRFGSTGRRAWRIPSNARITWCCRPMTSSVGNCRTHAETAFADLFQELVGADESAGLLRWWLVDGGNTCDCW